MKARTFVRIDAAEERMKQHADRDRRIRRAHRETVHHTETRIVAPS
jgi:hypothetical protein